MKTVAVVGGAGYVGSALVAQLTRNDFVVSKVTRATYEAAREKRYDVVINAAMPSGRFWAKNHPEKDFVETVQKTANLRYGFKCEKFIQISSVSARCQLDTVYGRHKAAAERLCDSRCLVVRLGPMFSETLSKGVLIDIVNDRPVFQAAESRYAFTNLDFVARWVAANLDREGIVEVGARDALALADVARSVRSKSTFEGATDHQEIANATADFPSANEVLPFIETMRAILTKTSKEIV